MLPHNVSRRCLTHFENNCTAPVCVADALDFATNPNRPRPRATVGAPEVSWGQVGRVHHVTPEERTAPKDVKVPEPATLSQLAGSILSRNSIRSWGA